MRTMRSGVARSACALAATVLLGSAASAQELRPTYTATLQFGTGLINTPVAWVSRRTGDVWVTSSGKGIDYQDGLNFTSRWNANFAVDVHWFGRASTGFSAYSQNPEWGFFGQLALLRDGDFGPVPGVAVGVRNVGKYKNEDRMLLGHDLVLESGEYRNRPGVIYRDFKTAPTVYGVATKELPLGAATGSLSVGYGNGLFSDDGGLGAAYNEKGQVAEGLFFGARLSAPLGSSVVLTVVGENDGWDWNAGVVADWRGISLGVYGTELEEGGMDTDQLGLGRIYNYAKVNVTLGYSGNVYDIARGVVLRQRLDELTREQKRLRGEIEARERRITELEVALRRAQEGELETIAKRRQELEAQIQQEREAIRAAEDRLRRLQEGQRPPSTPPPDGGSHPQRLH